MSKYSLCNPTDKTNEHETFEVERSLAKYKHKLYKPPRFPSCGSLFRKSLDRRRSCSRCRQSCDTVSDKIHLTNVSAINEADLWRKRVKLLYRSYRRSKTRSFRFIEKGGSRAYILLESNFYLARVSSSNASVFVERVFRYKCKYIIITY